jgi:GNAT superfamily N-acetyltransferase
MQEKPQHAKEALLNGSTIMLLFPGFTPDSRAVIAGALLGADWGPILEHNSLTEHLSLRPGRPDDESFLYDLYCSTRQAEIAGFGWPPAQTEMFLKMQFRALQHNYIAQAQINPDQINDRIILSEESPIGRLIVIRTDSEICLADIALLPQHRGRGVGTKLIRDLLAESTAAGKPVTLHVAKDNRAAVQLYAGLGFVVTEDIGIHFKMEWRS